jgi:hypothetical protein
MAPAAHLAIVLLGTVLSQAGVSSAAAHNHLAHDTAAETAGGMYPSPPSSVGLTGMAAPATGPFPSDSPEWARARAHYLLHCMGCHRADGVGTENRIPALRDRVGYYLGFADGRDYLLHVPGALNAPIADQDLASVMNWVIAEFGGASTPDAWSAITANEVTRARSLPPVDIDALRARVWAAVAAAHPHSSPY